jgi:hypothetical protein
MGWSGWIVHGVMAYPPVQAVNSIYMAVVI